MNLVLNPANVHVGGGFELLSAVLRSLGGDFQGRLILDERLHLPVILPGERVVHRVRATFWSRLRNEWYLRRTIEPDDLVWQDLAVADAPDPGRGRGKGDGRGHHWTSQGATADFIDTDQQQPVGPGFLFPLERGRTHHP